MKLEMLILVSKFLLVSKVLLIQKSLVFFHSHLVKIEKVSSCNSEGLIISK